MTLSERIAVFESLGKELLVIAEPNYNGPYLHYLQKTKAANPWFTPESISLALKGIADWLNAGTLVKWLGSYNLPKYIGPKNIGIVVAGNIPLVGFHDMLSVLILGHKATLKLSSRDGYLYQMLKDILVDSQAVLARDIIFTQDNVAYTDAIIATGSDNTARYFEYYFANRPHIIRKNRHSVAILSGHETPNDLIALGTDIFTYFGLGCRNVSMLLLPLGYNLNLLFEALEPWHSIINHNKYANNYDYQKAVMTLNRVAFLDNGFCLFREFNQLASPIAVVNYWYYNSDKQVEDYVTSMGSKIQCIISNAKWPFKTFGPGMAQRPQVTDYADEVDTIQFLLNLNN
jgi:hypothetical protein